MAAVVFIPLSPTLNSVPLAASVSVRQRHYLLGRLGRTVFSPQHQPDSAVIRLPCQAVSERTFFCLRRATEVPEGHLYLDRGWLVCQGTLYAVGLTFFVGKPILADGVDRHGRVLRGRSLPLVYLMQQRLPWDDLLAPL